MNDTINCPHCGKSIPLTEALSHQIQDKYAKFYKIRLEEEKNKFAKTLQPELEKQLKEKMEFEMKNKNNELEELRKQNRNMQEQMLELNKLIRQIKQESDNRRVEMEKKLTISQEKIREEEKRKSDEEYKLKILEKDKKLSDAMKMAEEYKRKLEQGSQQLQGEVLELEFENILRREFPYDEIKEVPKGIRGADILQVVKNNYGKTIGTIVWESKRTKSWSEGWIAKLKEDQRAVKADLAVIVTQILPNGIKNFLSKNKVWISNYDSIIGLATVLRDSLIRIAAVRLSEVDKQDKKTILWNYLNGIEFQNRIEAIGDIYNQMQEELEIEKRWFVKKWAKQEKNIRQVIDNISGMDGDLKSIMGKQLSEINESKKLVSGE